MALICTPNAMTPLPHSQLIREMLCGAPQVTCHSGLSYSAALMSTVAAANPGARCHGGDDGGWLRPLPLLMLCGKLLRLYHSTLLHPIEGSSEHEISVIGQGEAREC
jgi:hypothetical protein